MSFLKIKDPKKREALIKDFIETRKRIKTNFIEQKVGEIGAQRELSNFFKPVTETQKETTKDITEAQKTGFKELTEAQKAITEEIKGELLPIRGAVEDLPVKVATRVFNQVFPAIEFKESDVINIGPVTVRMLMRAYERDFVDFTFGLYAKDGKFYFGDKEVTIKNDDLEVGGAIYDGTPGLWNLIISKRPDPEIYTDDDYENYKNLNIQTNNLFKNNDPYISSPKGNHLGYKWNNIIKPIWEKIPKVKDIGKGKGKKKQKPPPKEDEDEEYEDAEEPQPSTSGTGLTQFIPSNPIALLERLHLLLASLKAGHSNVKNELVSIADELKRQGIINSTTYKKLNSNIKK